MDEAAAGHYTATRGRRRRGRRPHDHGEERVAAEGPPAGLLQPERALPRSSAHVERAGDAVRLFVQPVHSRRTTPGWVYHCDVVVGHMETLKDAFDYVRGSAKRQVFVQLVRCD